MFNEGYLFTRKLWDFLTLKAEIEGRTLPAKYLPEGLSLA
jgi:hypothetical protein